jgi:hypothetical protein
LNKNAKWDSYDFAKYIADKLLLHSVKASRKILGAFPIRINNRSSDSGGLPKPIGLPKAVAEILDVKPILEV